MTTYWFETRQLTVRHMVINFVELRCGKMAWILHVLFESDCWKIRIIMWAKFIYQVEPTQSMSYVAQEPKSDAAAYFVIAAFKLADPRREKVHGRLPGLSLPVIALLALWSPRTTVQSTARVYQSMSASPSFNQSGMKEGRCQLIRSLY